MKFTHTMNMKIKRCNKPFIIFSNNRLSFSFSKESNESASEPVINNIFNNHLLQENFSESILVKIQCLNAAAPGPEKKHEYWTEFVDVIENWH